MLRTFFKAAAYWFFKLLNRTEYVNLKNIPKEGPVILYANHISNADPFVLVCPIRRMVYCMAKEELFKNKLVGKFLGKMGVFPVKRGTGDIGAIKKSLEKLKAGFILAMFPEGTRRRKGITPEPKPGLALIAMKAKCPVLPAAILGTPRLFKKIKVIYGEPIDTSKYYKKDLTMEDYTEISKELMNEVEKLKTVDSVKLTVDS